MIIFETTLTVVRWWREDEADRVFDMLRRWEVMQWLGDDPTPMRERTEAVDSIARRRQAYERDPRFGVWCVEEKATGTAAGSVICQPLPNGSIGEVEIGWHFHPDSHRRGLATDAGRGLVAKAFADGHPELWAVTHRTNAPSQAVCGRLGMRDMGVVDGLWYAGESRIFCLTREEWSADGQADATGRKPEQTIRR